MSIRGKTIGNIRIREVLGEGGMGTVYAGFEERRRRRAVRGTRPGYQGLRSSVSGSSELRLARLSALDAP